MDYVVSRSEESAEAWVQNPTGGMYGVVMPADGPADAWTWVATPFNDDGSITEGHVWYASDWYEVPDVTAIVRSVHQLAEKYEEFTYELA